MLENNSQIYYPAPLENMLIHAIKNLELDAIKCIIQIIEDENLIVHGISPDQLAYLNTRMINTLFHFHSQQSDFSQLMIRLNECVIKCEPDCKAYFSQLIDACCHISSYINQKKQTQKSVLINQISHYIEKHYKNPALGLSAIAAEFHISEGYLSSVFKDYMNMNFTEYVEQLRIQDACRLLKETDQTIGDISEQVGYNSVYSFRRAFKRSMSYGPGEYRSSALT